MSWLVAMPRPDRSEYRLAGTDWSIIGKTDPERGRYVYSCYHGMTRRAVKDSRELAMAYCERDGKAYIYPWDRRSK